MLSYRLGTVNAFHWGFKPILSYRKPHTFLTFSEKKKKKYAFTLSNSWCRCNKRWCNEIKKKKERRFDVTHGQSIIVRVVYIV